MNVTIISTLENGGAASASKRLKQGLELLDISLFFLTKNLFEKYLDKKYKFNFVQKILILLRKRKKIKSDYLVINSSRSLTDYYSLPQHNQPVHLHPSVINADCINIHWTSDFISYPGFFKNTIKKPLIITLHDMNYFTGGCHYSFDCRKFEESQCEYCWQLEGSLDQNASQKAFQLKLSSFLLRSPENTAIVAPSVWLLEESKKSKILGRFAHYHIPYGIDTSIFKMSDKLMSRKKLQIDYPGRLLLFIATDVQLYRKGYHLLQELLPYMKEQDVKILLVGNSGGLNFENDAIFNKGKISDMDILSLCYSACDAMIFPTIADNLPNTLLESLCCGTPVLGFTVGGLPDIIINGKNGYLSAKKNVDGLKEVISLFFEHGIKDSPETIKNEAMENFNLKVQAGRYYNLFKKLCYNDSMISHSQKNGII